MIKWNVGWGPVSTCNMNCQFCYSRHRRTGERDLELWDWKRFVDENHKRIRTINYGTGENTMDPDWFRLVSYIRERYPEIRQALTTNGYLAPAVAESEELRNMFEKSIDEVDISLDFCDPVRHGRLRGQPHAYDWAIEALRMCRLARKPTTLVFLGSRVNLTCENVDGLFALARQYDAILRMNLFRPTMGVDERSNRFVVSDDDVVGILKHIAARYGVLALNDALYSARLVGAPSPDPSGDRSVRILSDGSITPSTYLIDERYVVGNIQEKNALAAVEARQKIPDIMSGRLPQECEPCAYRDLCRGGVYDRRYLWYGTLARRDPLCPGPVLERRDPVVKLTNRKFASVHDGYLPTMFFTPYHEGDGK